MNTVAKSFAELLFPRAGNTVAENQLAARSAFAELVESTDLRLWRPGQPIEANGRRLLIGVATYSVHDLKLLDLVQSHLTSQSQNGNVRFAAGIALSVDVFDILDCRTPDDFEKYVPGVGPVSQTPVVGLWADGELTENAFGYDGRMLIYRTCKLPAVESDQVIFPR
jgi:hypothetical protein